MDIIDIICKMLGAGIVFGIGKLILTNLIEFHKVWWLIIALFFSVIFAYLPFWLESETGRTVLLMSVKWGSFGLALLALENARKKHNADRNADRDTHDS